MSNQAKLDAITTQLGSISTQFDKGRREVLGEIDRLRNQAPEELDFSRLDAAVAGLAPIAAALDEAIPDVEAEEPEQPEEPVVVPSEPGTDQPAPALPVDAEEDDAPVDSENPRI